MPFLTWYYADCGCAVRAAVAAAELSYQFRRVVCLQGNIEAEQAAQRKREKEERKRLQEEEKKQAEEAAQRKADEEAAAAKVS